ncbi:MULTISPECIES: hypothetical protein [unclassified Streptosporangium]|uniref:hypothetical protein n=1 Tax=unclassified Streptosporangium TaxID=2632669 RepID=UPI002E2921EE|nr:MULTISPECIES: hypothetical protein [unclassified Streptosporangium]
MTGAVPTQLRVPYVIAHADEVAPQRLRFARRPLGGLRLVYDDPRRGDMACGVLRVRVLNNRQGPPQWRKLNTLRQWRCMGATRGRALRVNGQVGGRLCRVCSS